MDFDPSPNQILIAPFAIYFALVVGIPLSNARNAAAMPLIAECWPALSAYNAEGLSLLTIVDFVVCGSGVTIIYLVPGAIGIFLLTMNLH